MKVQKKTPKIDFLKNLQEKQIRAMNQGDIKIEDIHNMEQEQIKVSVERS